ncbi:putative membrane protein [Bernardetia litoralis DSM 6794]|uniref:Putative membrane protein n=1 Tax=Bernardetia litoralis (strain ATCC 23117 / DSM 6794 / NBRC 15988 / NCIMB 1366 / Fx l1 / Sio-4) TaxID=880071 RepID=I4ALJ7_BERLS|nr:TQO small subunit DoxD [Bernardetia litoralis]AFM04832.1 putative membrane protein [Bernardetia litoralis DSM 6794]
MNISNNNSTQSYSMTGAFSLALRLVVGWTYFSAFWRRLFLANKLDPEQAGYIGEKFNHFLPNALGIKPIIQYLVENPDILWWSMVSFTIIEGIVGLLIMFGFFTRLMSIGVFGLAMGILLGSGWIGTTCLDEWQIGVLGIASGFTLFLTGSGYFSLDHFLIKNNYKLVNWKGFQWLGSGFLPLSQKNISTFILLGGGFILFLTLFTNQYFHGGVWGTLHNKSVKPKIEIIHSLVENNKLTIEVYRVEGVDVYGSFLIGIDLINENNENVFSLNGTALSKLNANQIKNDYVAKVKTGAHSLIIPLGAKATITLTDSRFSNLKKGKYRVLLTDISGATWQYNLSY